MLRLANLSIRRPRASLAAWAVFAVVLALIGFGVSDRLSPTRTFVPGTESSRAQDLAKSKFGPSTLVPILLQGPKAQLDRQGPQLVRALLKRPHTRALSAWDTGTASQGLRPRPTAAMIVLSVDRPLRDVFKTDQAQIERTVHRVVSGPVRAHITGQAALDRAIRSESIDTTRRAELIAMGILFLLLLIGLRAPIAALVVAGFGAVTALTSLGALALWAKFVETEPIAIPFGTMLGLGFGVGFALLIVDRFREREFPPGSPPRDAASAASEAVATTGRAVLLSATAVVVALTVAGLTGPSVNLFAAGAGTVICASLGAGAAVVVMPAVLTILGTRITAFSFPAPRLLAGGWDRLVGAGSFVTRRAVIVGAVATGVLAVLAIPAFSLKTGPPDVSQLPKNSTARQDYEAIARVMGAGWASPFNIVVASPNQPITSSAMLARIEALQHQIALDPRVDSVVGPGAFVAQTKDLGKLPKGLQDSAKLVKGGKKDLGRLEGGLGQAGAGAQQLQAGLKSAADGAGKLHGGSGQAQSGAGQLHTGLGAARSGALQIKAGLDQALAGAVALRKGANQALAGSGQLTAGLGTAETPVKAGLPTLNQLVGDLNTSRDALGTATGTAQTAGQQTSAALAALEGFTTGKDDPRYQAALSALRQARDAAGGLQATLGDITPKVSGAATVAGAVAGQTSALAKGLTQLHDGSSQLQAGIKQLRDGNAALASGIGKLSGGGSQLTGGLTQLRDGAGALEAGLGQLTSGTGQLQSGLAGGVGPSGQLISGLSLMQAGVAKFRGQLPSTKDLEKLRAQSPGLFDSGYFVLAAIAGARPSDRNAATFAVNLGQGGNAGQIVVIPAKPTSDLATRQLADRLKTLGSGFAARTHTQVAVGGPAGELVDFANETNSRLPWVIAALAIAMALVLMVALRAVLLPLAATALTGLAVLASVGILKLLIGGSDPVLGGPGYIDPMSLIETLAGLTGIATIYAMLLLQRGREAYLASGDLDEALRIGMRRTAAGSIGAVAVMVAAVIPFTTSGLMNIRYAVVLAVLVILEALIVRPVILPAAVKALGPRAWWPTYHSSQAPAEPRKPRTSRLHRPIAGGGK